MKTSIVFSLLATNVLAGGKGRKPKPCYNQHPHDFIVVGSGPGGGPLAVTLAQKGFKVLLVEAGDHFYTQQSTAKKVLTPALNAIASEDEYISWNFKAQMYPSSSGDRQNVLYPRASVVGGCSASNALINQVPHTKDFDGISSTFGDDSWSDANMRKYYTSIENVSGSNINPVDHGTSGWYFSKLWDSLKTASTPTPDDALKAVFDAPKTFETPTSNNDLNAKQNNMKEGYHNVPINVHDGKRAGLIDHLIQAQNTIPNLTIQTNTHVTKIIFEGKVAVGIEAIQGKALYKAHPKYDSTKPGTPVKFYANREIIISAGTYNTPQILMLSGIGDKEALLKLGIKPIVNLKGVGKNLMDRNEVGVVSNMKNWFASTAKCFTFDPNTDTCLKDYLQTGEGIYGSNFGIVGITKKFPENSQDRDDMTPNVYILGLPVKFTGYYEGFSTTTINPPGKQTWLVLKGHTKNTGSVTLKSTDPFDTPIINFNIFPGGLNDPDLSVVVESVKYVRKLNTVQTDDQIKKWIMDNAWGHHACCTSKMGLKKDPYAVVDQNFKVYGTKNLRVVDASVFPKIPGFFIQTPIYMISGKAADAILSDSRAQCI